MSLTYTTKEAIANRLEARLQVGGAAATFGKRVVNDNLIEQVGEQVEARVNARLKAVYTLPLSGPHPALASVVEKLVICEIIGVYAIEQLDTVGRATGDGGGFGSLMCRQGADELEAILSGTIVLEGETTLSGGDSSTLVGSTTVAVKVGKRTSGKIVEF
jgi:hypothetical protein